MNAPKTMYTIMVMRSEHEYPHLDSTDEELAKLGFSGFKWLDMLRYDSGKIIEVQHDGFLVYCPCVTEGRWASFGKKVTVVKTEKIPTQKQYQRIIDDNRLWFAQLSLDLYKATGWTGSSERVSDAENTIRTIGLARQKHNYWK